VLAAGFLKLVDRLTELTRLTNAMRALSATQRGIFTNTVTMSLFLQDPFNFNVEISVSRGICRYHDVAGFRPRAVRNLSGAPAGFGNRLAKGREKMWLCEPSELNADTRAAFVQIQLPVSKPNMQTEVFITDL